MGVRARVIRNWPYQQQIHNEPLITTKHFGEEYLREQFLHLDLKLNLEIVRPFNEYWKRCKNAIR